MNIKRIIREEMDDFDWIREVNFGLDMFINKAFYFTPRAEEHDEDYTKLVNHLIDMGFKSEYYTPRVLEDDETATGLYAYRNIEGDLKYVYTTGDMDDDDDYEQHIKRYASNESEDHGENLEVVDAREFIKLNNSFLKDNSPI